MTRKPYAVVGIGNAIVDILCDADDSFLSCHGINKGIMQLIDLERAKELYSLMDSYSEVSGGSVANTIAGLAECEIPTSFIGKVKDDYLGSVFAEDFRALNSDFRTPMLDAGAECETGRCMVIVTPDGERSMNTYLGAAEQLSPADMDEELLSSAEWIYLEGYRFDGPNSQEAFRKAISCARNAGGRVSLTLSDPFCVERHRDAFRGLIGSGLDLLLCNRAELLAMYETEDLDEALDGATQGDGIVACTLSGEGAVVARSGQRWPVRTPNVRVVDATGAGDLFAAGFLFGLADGKDLQTCGRMGCVAAAEVIGHVGARPLRSMIESFRADGIA